MRRALRVLAWTATALVGLIVAAYLVWLAGNLVDDELSPEVRSIVSDQPAQINPKDNAYFDIVGLDAPSGENPHTFGLKRFEQMVATDRVLDEGAETKVTPAGKLSVKPADIPCQKAENCFAEVAAHTAAVRKVLDQEAVLLGRLDSMLDAPYQEPHRNWAYWSYIPSYTFYNAAVRLALARFALLAQEGRYDDALRHWARLARFTERQIEGSESLIGKAVTMATLHRQHLVLAQFINANPAVARANAKMISGLLPPLSQNQLAVSPAIRNEVAQIANSTATDLPHLRRLMGSEAPGMSHAILDVFLEPFYKENATMNEAADRILAWSKLDGLEGPAYRQALLALQGEQAKLEDIPLRYRNPLGQVLLSMAVPDYATYFYRRDTLVAERRLMAFGIRRLEQGCAALSPELAHPFTGELPVWNAEKRVLSYAVASGAVKGSGFAPLEIAVPDCH